MTAATAERVTVHRYRLGDVQQIADGQVRVVPPAELPGERLISRREREVPDQLSTGRLGNPGNCASSSSENTSLVATGAPSPKKQTPMENT